MAERLAVCKMQTFIFLGVQTSGNLSARRTKSSAADFQVKLDPYKQCCDLHRENKRLGRSVTAHHLLRALSTVIAACRWAERRDVLGSK
jgi:hypothetical protein